MIHKNCGGEIIEKKTLVPYLHKREDGKIEEHYPLICQKCKEEITSDSQAVLED